jgi:glycosyltransferase involved in cell wall biosynthesis
MFSLCIPTYNRFDSFLSKYLPLYIENPLIDEIIITDENGEDKKKIDRIYSNEPKVKTFQNPTILGVFKNRMNAMQKSRNEWICTLDSDNFADVDYFEAAAKYIHQEEQEQEHEEKKKTMVLMPSSIRVEYFNFDHFKGLQFQKKDVRNLFHQKNFTVLINTGNFIVNRYMMDHFDFAQFNENHSFFGPYLKGKGLPLNITLLCIFLMLQFDATFCVVPDMHYSHIVHNGSYYLESRDKIAKLGPKLESFLFNIK